MNNTFTIPQVRTSVLPTVPQDLPQQLQNKIVQGHESAVKQLIQDGVSLIEPLPNGELPLHFAVRENQLNIVSLLLKHGVDPEALDFQNMSAIDHCAILKNEPMLIRILAHKIGKGFQEIQQQLQHKGSFDHITQLKEQIQKILTLDSDKLSPFSLKISSGELDFIHPDIIRENMNLIDVNGLCPIHYAILSGRPAAVAKLLEWGALTDVVSSNGDSLLHFAALSKSKEILNLLIGKGIDPNHRNFQGATALHYAAANGTLEAVEILVKKKGDPCLLDHGGMSPLALIGHDASQRDPLSRANISLVLCGITLLQLFSSAALSHGWLTNVLSEHTLEMLESMSGRAELLVSFMVEGNALQSLVFATLMMYQLGYTSLESLGWVPLILRIVNTGKSALMTLQSCWRNARYRKWDAARTFAVTGFNLGRSFALLYSKFFYPVGDYSIDPKDLFKPIKQKKIALLERQGLESRLNYPELNVKLPSHALAAICPSCVAETVSGALPDPEKLRFAYWKNCNSLKNNALTLSLMTKTCPTPQSTLTFKNLNIARKTVNALYALLQNNIFLPLCSLE